jgi:hypothetical protein
MRTNIEIDDRLMAEAQKASGHMQEADGGIRLRRQGEVASAFGKYR